MPKFRVYGRKEDVISLEARSKGEAWNAALKADGDGWFNGVAVEITEIEREDTTEREVRKALGDAERAVREAIEKAKRCRRVSDEWLSDGLQAAQTHLDMALDARVDCDGME